MICPKCHGNGYRIEQLKVLRQVRQCETCNSKGEIKEKPMSLKNQEDIISYDFTLDNIISVKDSAGLDPSTLHDKCLEQLQHLINTNDINFLFEKIFDERRKVG